MNSNLKYITLVAILIRVVISYVPLYQFSVSTMVNMGTFFAIYVGLYSDRHFKKNFSRLWPICSLLLLSAFYSVFSAEGSIGVELYGFLQLMIWPLSGYYIINNFSKKQIKYILYAIGIVFAITLYTTCVGCIEFPNAARMLASSKDENKELELLYHSLNIGGFMFVYTVILIAPLLVYLYKYSIVNKFIVIPIYLSLFFLVITTEYTTALLFMAMITSLFFLSKDYVFKKNHLYIVAILSGIILLFGNQISSVFSSLAGVFESESISDRFNEMSTAMSGGNLDDSSDLNQRNLAWSTSLNLFFNNLIFGDGKIYGGGHSYLLDTLAHFGLIGLFFLIAIFKRMYKEYIAPYAGTNVFVYILALYILNLMQCLLNTTNSIFVMCFILPLFMSVYYSKEISYGR